MKLVYPLDLQHTFIHMPLRLLAHCRAAAEPTGIAVVPGWIPAALLGWKACMLDTSFCILLEI